MSLADEAKLLLIPSGYKSEKVYSVFPIDGDGDFTFSRSGNARRVNPGGLIETVGTNIPRIDHFGGGCPSLLLEPQRTNTQVKSEEFDDSLWVKSRTTITANNAISPDGEFTADKLTGTGTGSSYIFSGNYLSYGFTYSISIFVKPIINIPSFAIMVFGSVGTAYFNLVDKTVNSFTGNFTSAKIEDYGNGWLRCSGTLTLSSSSGTKNIGYGLVNFNGDQFYLFGAQVEQGNYVTSYMKTSYFATRLIENCHLLNQTLFTNYPFTVYAKAKIEEVDNTIFSLLNSTNSNTYLLFKFSSGTSVSVFRRIPSANDSDSYSFTYSVGDIVKVAISFISENSYKLYVNGIELADITSGTSIPFQHNDIALGQFRIASDTGTRNSIDDFRVYDYTLTETQLTELTTL